MRVSTTKRDNRILRVYNENDHSDNNDWLTVYWNKSVGLVMQLDWGFYFDRRVTIHMKLLWLQFFLHLPIYTKNNDCEWPSYGFRFEKQSLVLNLGRKNKYFDWPWSLQWYRTSAQLKDRSFEHEYKGNRKEFYDREKWRNKIAYQVLPYKYTLRSGEVQNVEARIYVDQREWRRKWLMFTSLFNKVRTSIEIEFSKEVGERAGFWKGGVTGCSYEMLPGETPAETLKRMEAERKFN